MEKFTVVVTHYNQMEYIEESIKSVLNQTYKNIELIVADDCSKTFNKKKVEEIIKKHNKNNYQYKVIQGKTNVGTVKNLNNAIKEATGEYILFFAADDKLATRKVVENFIKAFSIEGRNIVTTQCLLYDHYLKEMYCVYVNSKKALKLNKESSHKIYERMAEGCFYGSGGTAYRLSIFKKYGNFNEKYKYVEDWAYWLYVLRCGEKIYYEDFETLSHRDGGISHSIYTKETLPPHVRQYYIDIMNIYDKEVLPYINTFKISEKYRILKQFDQTALAYSSYVPELIKYHKMFDEIRLNDKKLKYYWKYKTFIDILKNSVNCVRYNLMYNKVVLFTIICWLLVNILIINKNIENNNALLLLSYIAAYIIIYYPVYFCKVIFSIIKEKTGNHGGEDYV